MGSSEWAQQQQQQSGGRVAGSSRILTDRRKTSCSSSGSGSSSSTCVVGSTAMPTISSTSWQCSRGVLLAVLVILAAAALLPVSSAQAQVPKAIANTLPCVCTDVDVRESFISLVNFTCWQQYEFGKCNESFIMDSIKEVPEGYCEISCGRCPCCGSLAAAAAAAGLTEFLWAMNRTDDRGIFLDAPGFAATVFAPDNAAMAALFAKLGGKAVIDADAGVRGKLAVIMSYHIAKPLPGYEAWTTPFLLPGTKLETHLTGGNGTLTIASGGDGGVIKVLGAQGGADITQKDIYACKGYINKLNWYLVPQGQQLQA